MAWWGEIWMMRGTLIMTGRIAGAQTNIGMVSLQPSLTFLLNNLPARPFDQQELNSLVCKTLAEAKLTSSQENRKAQWEYLLKADIFDLAVTS
jgi:hypothetical protein